MELRADGEIIVLDAGTGIRPLGIALDREFQARPIKLSLLITHAHWDHIQGFPFFKPAYDSKNEIRIFGFDGAGTTFREIMTEPMKSPFFPISMRELSARMDINKLNEMKFSLGKFDIHATFVNHPGVCAGYRIFTSGGSVAFLPDHEPYEFLNDFHNVIVNRINLSFHCEPSPRSAAALRLSISSTSLGFPAGADAGSGAPGSGGWIESGGNGASVNGGGSSPSLAKVFVGPALEFVPVRLGLLVEERAEVDISGLARFSARSAICQLPFSSWFNCIPTRNSTWLVAEASFTCEGSIASTVNPAILSFGFSTLR